MLVAEDDHTDVLRRLDRLTWRADALDEWRTKVDGRISVLESEVLTVREGRILEETLRRQKSDHQKLRLTRGQQFGGFVVAAVAMFDLVKGLF